MESKIAEVSGGTRYVRGQTTTTSMLIKGRQDRQKKTGSTWKQVLLLIPSVLLASSGYTHLIRKEEDLGGIAERLRSECRTMNSGSKRKQGGCLN